MYAYNYIMSRSTTTSNASVRVEVNIVGKYCWGMARIVITCMLGVCVLRRLPGGQNASTIVNKGYECCLSLTTKPGPCNS